MRITTVITGSAIAAALTAALVGVVAPADAATVSHLATARVDWMQGAKSAAASESSSWLAARHQLGAYGHRYAHESADLTTLTEIPLTDTTAAQRATAARVTRELNGFFHTPGLYGVTVGNAKSIARADWIKSAQVSAADANAWLGAARDELAAYGARYNAELTELISLESIPLTDTTATQRATARRDVRALDNFFQTPGVRR